MWKDSNIPSPINRLDHHKANNINLLNPYRMPCFKKRDDYKSGSERKYCTLYLWNSPGLFSRQLIQYAFLVSVIQDYTINGIKLKVWLCRTKRSAIQWVHILSCEWVKDYWLEIMSLITPELCSTNFKLARQLGACYVVNFQLLNEAAYHHPPRPP